ncbi:hypothetical protein, partial [Bacillus mycoides]|uniref:hypothetical protein n=1 Tax=Bacillus mycoides TaxID=1405 RepID=UPI003A7FC603
MTKQTYGVGFGMNGELEKGFTMDAVAVKTGDTFKVLPTIVVDNNRANEDTVFLEPNFYFTKRGLKNKNTTFASHTVKRIIDDREVSVLACEGLKDGNFIHVVEVDTDDFPKGDVENNLYLVRVTAKPKKAPSVDWLRSGGFRLLEEDFQLGFVTLKTLKELKPSKAKKNLKSLMVAPKFKKELREDKELRQNLVELVDEVLAGARFELNSKVETGNSETESSENKVT